MINESISALASGNPLVIFDDGAPVPCAYILVAAKSITEEQVKFLVNIGKGIILVPLQEDLSKERGLSSLSTDSKHPFPLTIGVEAREGVGSGISISDRTKTIKAILNSNINHRTIVAPGHIFPLLAKKEGLLVKTGIAEATCDLLKIANLPQIGVISHCLNNDGGYAMREEIENLCKKYDLPLLQLSSIVQYRLINEKLVTSVSEANLPTTEYGTFKARCFVSSHDGAEHLVLSQGDLLSPEPVLTRMHSEKKLADIFSLTALPEREKIDKSLKRIAEEGRGVLVYIKKANKNLISTQIETEGNSLSSDKKVSALREVGVGAQILKEMGLKDIRLLTNEKKILNNLDAYGINIVEQVQFL